MCYVISVQFQLFLTYLVIVLTEHTTPVTTLPTVTQPSLIIEEPGNTTYGKSTKLCFKAYKYVEKNNLWYYCKAFFYQE